MHTPPHASSILSPHALGHIRPPYTAWSSKVVSWTRMDVLTRVCTWYRTAGLGSLATVYDQLSTPCPLPSRGQKCRPKPCAGVASRSWQSVFKVCSKCGQSVVIVWSKCGESMVLLEYGTCRGHMFHSQHFILYTSFIYDANILHIQQLEKRKSKRPFDLWTFFAPPVLPILEF